MVVEEIFATAFKRVDTSAGYAGDVTAEEAWRLVKVDPDAYLIDIRTRAEWSCVGIPDLSPIGREPVLAQWQVAPAMNENPNFINELAAQKVTPDKVAIFMCRTVNRSPRAARAMTANGYTRCYYLIDGFEGSLDEHKHRGNRDGWKAAGLPWVQG